MNDRDTGAEVVCTESRRNHPLQWIRLEVLPVGKGWRVSIYPPDSASALRESPSILEKVLKETVIAEAKKIVDARGATD